MPRSPLTPRSLPREAARAAAALDEVERAEADLRRAVELLPDSAAKVGRARRPRLLSAARRAHAGSCLRSLTAVCRHQGLPFAPPNCTQAEVHEDLARLHQKRKDYRRAEAELRVRGRAAHAASTQPLAQASLR